VTTQLEQELGVIDAAILTALCIDHITPPPGAARRWGMGRSRAADRRRAERAAIARWLVAKGVA
jgi:hypothetical protein